MRMKHLIPVALLLAGAASAASIDGTFNYQGRLTSGGAPITGNADVRFSLWDDAVAGVQKGPTVDVLGASVTDGLFNADLDFGVAALNGQQRWLQVEVRSPAGVGSYVNLGRQSILGAPYAIQTRGIFVDDALNVGVGTISPRGVFEARHDDSQQALIFGPTGPETPDLQLYSHDDQLVAYHVPFYSNEGTASQLVFTGGDGTTNAIVGTSALGAQGFLSVLGEDSAFNFTVLGDPGGALDGVSNTRMSVRSSGVGGVGGEVEVRNNDGIATVSLLGGGSGASGSITMLDPATGIPFFQAIEDDTPGDPGGGLLRITRNNAGDIGFEVNGNFVGTDSTAVLIDGDNPISFTTSATGSGTVSLPTDAIAAYEMLDEPGVASYAFDGGGLLAGSSTIETLASRTITAPAAGYVIVIGTCSVNASHNSGTVGLADFGVSDSSTAFPSGEYVEAYTSADTPTSSFTWPVTSHGVFPVSAGAHTFYFLGVEHSGNYGVYNPSLALLYVPTAYGTVTPIALSRGSGGDGSTPMSAAAIRAEQLEAAAFDRARRDADAAEYERRLAELEARMREFESRLTNGPAGRADPALGDENHAALGHDKRDSAEGHS